MPPSPTSRLTFRSWTDADLPHALALWGNPQVTRLIDARGQLDEAQVREKLAAELDRERRCGMQYWATFTRDGAFAGCCGVRPYAYAVDLGPDVVELGCHLLPAFWKSGFATEAAQAAIAHAFGALGMRRVFAGHHPDNAGSRRLVEKLGFTKVGEFFFPPTGLMHPGYVRER